MDHYTHEQRVFIVEKFYLLEKRIDKVQGCFKKKFTLSEPPSEETINLIIAKFEREGNVREV